MPCTSPRALSASSFGSKATLAEKSVFSLHVICTFCTLHIVGCHVTFTLQLAAQNRSCSLTAVSIVLTWRVWACRAQGVSPHHMVHVDVGWGSYLTAVLDGIGTRLTQRGRESSDGLWKGVPGERFASLALLVPYNGLPCSSPVPSSFHIHPNCPIQP